MEKPMKLIQGLGVLATAALAATPASADELNQADTAWMLTATALVLFMTLPGLAMFYGGLARARNVLSMLMQCLSITALMSVISSG